MVPWAEHPDATLLAERMNNGAVHPSAQGHGGGTQRELSPWGGGGGSDTRVAKKLLIISFNQIITKLPASWHIHIHVSCGYTDIQ